MSETNAPRSVTEPRFSNQVIPVPADELARLLQDSNRYWCLRSVGCAIVVNDAVHWFRDERLDAAIDSKRMES